MQYNRTVNISELLQDSALAKVMQKGIWLNELNQQFKRLFPSQFEGLYGIANIDQTTLSIEVANSAVRQGLLFKQQELLKLVQRHSILRAKRTDASTVTFPWGLSLI